MSSDPPFSVLDFVEESPGVERGDLSAEQIERIQDALERLNPQLYGQAPGGSPPADEGLLDTEPVATRLPSGGVSISAGERSAPSVESTVVPETELVEGSGVSLLSFAIDIEATTRIDLTIDPGRSGSETPDLPSGFDPIGVFEVNANAPPSSDIAAVGFGIAVDKGLFDGFSDFPTDLTLLRGDGDGSWVPLRTIVTAETPSTYQSKIVSPGLSPFALAIADTSGGGDVGGLDGTPIQLPQGDPRSDVDITAVFSSPEDVETTLETEELIAGLDLTNLDPEGYPTVAEGVFEIENTGDSAVGFLLSTTEVEIDLVADTGIVPNLLGPGQSAPVSIVIEPPQPNNQLWVSLGVPTLIDSDDRAIPGDLFPDVGSGGCANEAEAPVMVSSDIAFEGDDPSWLPDTADTSKLHHRVPGVLNLRQTGSIEEEITVGIPETDGNIDGSLIAAVKREGGGNVEDVTFDMAEIDSGSIKRNVDLIFESNGSCESQFDAIVLDNIGELSIQVGFERGGEWEEITGAVSHETGVEYYTPGRSLVQETLEARDEAMRTWAEQTISAVFPGGPVTSYRSARIAVTRGAQGTRVGSGASLIAIWDGFDDVPETPPLSPSSVAEEAVVEGVLGGAASVDTDSFPNFFPGLTNAPGISEYGIGMYGPSLYFSDAPGQIDPTVDVTVRIKNAGTRAIEIAEINFEGRVIIQAESELNPGGTFETTTSVPQSVETVTIAAETTDSRGQDTNEVSASFTSIEVTRDIPEDRVLEISILGGS
jgi:hypothetical protein